MKIKSMFCMAVMFFLSCNDRITNDSHDVAPSIITHPISQTVHERESVTFSIEVSGIPMPSIQWQKNTIDIVNANQSTYTISSATFNDAGNYRAIITNSQGSLTSATALLTVNEAYSLPIITLQPISASILSGRSITFSVTAMGNPQPTYQWQKNNTNIPNETSSVYTISSATSQNAGNYKVVVSNLMGNIFSDVATLNIVPPCKYGMKYLSSGTFSMGQISIAVPVHNVTISSFLMDSTEVTQTEYQRLMGINPSEFTGNSLRPVETVTWYDAVIYCNERSKSEGKDTVYSYLNKTIEVNKCTYLSELTFDFNKNGYRLPTEAEWEYAYRGRTTTTYFWGNTDTDANTYSWNFFNSSIKTNTVAMKSSNTNGLYDMAGNTIEWCNDLFGAYSSNNQTDPIGNISGNDRVARGGNFLSTGTNLAAALRTAYPAYASGSMIGFRVVCKP